MSEVPKFVRQRLEQQSLGGHPDANLLAAFTEGALSGGEREQVLAHLSACATCREIMALSLPEGPSAAAQPALARMRWARWPMLRWAGVTAAVVVVAAAVMFQHSRRAALEQFVRTEAPAKPATSDQAQPAIATAKSKPVAESGPHEKRAESNSRQAKSEQAEEKKDTRRFDAPISVPQAQPAANAMTTRQPAGELAMQAADAPQKAQAPPQPAAIGGSAPGVVGGAAAVDQAQLQQQAASKPPQATPRAPQGSVESVQVVRGADAVAAEPQARIKAKAALNRAVDGVGPAPAMETTAYRTHVARWRVSADGAVERSPDGGQTWQRLGIGNAPFRTVASVDGQVWAGGAGGTLYHSRDNGRTWRQVVVKSADLTLHSDIARVEFNDVQHGIVTTTGGETWTTADGGATWSVGQPAVR